MPTFMVQQFSVKESSKMYTVFALCRLNIFAWVFSNLLTSDFPALVGHKLKLE